MDFNQQLMPLWFVLTGTISVLTLKYMSILQCEGKDGTLRDFQHPVFLTILMFFSQALFFILYKLFMLLLRLFRRTNETYDSFQREVNIFSMLFPTVLDVIGTILAFSGLYLTYVSSFQMLRGAGIIFVGIFGSMYLNQTLIIRHWMAMFTIACSVTVIMSIDVQRVYYDNMSIPDADSNGILTGNFLILCSIIFHGAKFVYDEKKLKAEEYDTIQAAGWQGIFGFVITAVFAICCNYLPSQAPFDNNSRVVFDDFEDIISQLKSNPELWYLLIIFMFCSGTYNCSSLMIIKLSSASNHILASDLQILLTWTLALLLEWEYFNLITLSAFIILIMGTVAYRQAIFLTWYRSVLSRLASGRFVILQTDNNERENAPTSRPADVI